MHLKDTPTPNWALYHLTKSPPSPLLAMALWALKGNGLVGSEWFQWVILGKVQLQHHSILQVWVGPTPRGPVHWRGGGEEAQRKNEVQIKRKEIKQKLKGKLAPT